MRAARCFSGAALLAVTMLAGGLPAGAQAPADVPAGQWARPAVVAVVSRGVMAAPGGKFDGSRKVTRTELAVSLAKLAQALERGAWPKGNRSTIKQPAQGNGWRTAPVTRYELAALLDKVARNAAMGLPKPAAKPYLASEALPAPFTPKGVAPSNPAYPALSYLAKNRMVWPGSVLLKPGPTPITGEQVVKGVVEMLAGLNDRLTDEPQNREEIAPRPTAGHGGGRPR